MSIPTNDSESTTDGGLVVGGLLAAKEAVGTAAGMAPESLSEAELSWSVAHASALESQAASLKLSLLAEADRREIARRQADSGTDAWASRLTGSTQAIMRGGIWLARLLRDQYAATRQAFASGGINEAQARVIVKAAQKMPAEATDSERRDAEEQLVAKALGGTNAKGLRQAARRMLGTINQRLADRHEATMLDQETARAEHETYLGLWDNADGSFSGKFTIPELHGQLLRTALEKLTSPRRLSRNRAGDQTIDESAASTATSGRNHDEHLGAGFCELIEHLPTDRWGPMAASLIITLDYAHLLDGLASAGMDTGTRISAGLARRLACNAGIIPAVLGGPSARLDLGREQRLFTPAQRRACQLDHDTCAVDGCERPYAWCELHHQTPWAHGGNTDLANAIPLCGFHHRRAHDPTYTLTSLPSGEVRIRHRTRSGEAFKSITTHKATA